VVVLWTVYRLWSTNYEYNVLIAQISLFIAHRFRL
jgi:hypothetical protein